MKIMPFIKNFEKKHANATLFIGIAIGIGVGMYISALFSPIGMHMRTWSNHDRYERQHRYMQNVYYQYDNAVDAAR
jgi:hypothetical protein